MTVTVVNMYKTKYDVYIGRARKGEPYNKWCNPFRINEEIGNTREVVLEKFRKYLWECINNGTITKQELLDLDGKVLGCFCSPKPCHGDIIAKAVEFWVYNNTVTNRLTYSF